MLHAANNAETKLAEDVGKDVETITVDDANVLPDTPFLVTIGDTEIVKVTNVDGDELMVERGQEDTDANSHDKGAQVENRWTAGMYEAIGKEIDSHIPKGLIAMWSGSDLPAGWFLCDGKNGTPDLRDRFIVGVGDEYNQGDTGGKDSVTLSKENLPSHSHGSGDLKTDTTGDHKHTYSETETSVTKMFGGSSEGLLVTSTSSKHPHHRMVRTHTLLAGKQLQ